jgi:ABC-type nitrate/sulfonate/bicarbonate transport system permease component
MLVSQRGWQTANVFSAIVIIVVLSLLLFGLIALAERILVRSSRQNPERGE